MFSLCSSLPACSAHYRHNGNLVQGGRSTEVVRGMSDLSWGAFPELPRTLGCIFYVYSFTICFQMEQLALSPCLQRIGESPPICVKCMQCRAAVAIRGVVQQQTHCGCSVITIILILPYQTGGIIFSLLPELACIHSS